MVCIKSLQKMHMTDAKSVETGRKLARKVVKWMEFRCGDTDTAIIRTAQMFFLDESNLRTLFKRPQVLKTVSHTMIANLQAADAYVDQIMGTIERAEADNQQRIEELTAPAAPERNTVEA